MLSIEESVRRFDNGVGRGRNADADEKRLIFSFGTENWPAEMLFVDRDDR